VKYTVLVLLAATAFACTRDSGSQTPVASNTALWWTYLADYDGLPGSTVVNLGLKSRAPLSGYATLVVTGVTYEAPPERSGLPTDDELDFLNQLSEKRLTLIAQSTEAILAGSFTHKNERLDYVYVRDAGGLQERLTAFYDTAAPNRRPYINVIQDADWEGYLSFLYPNQQTLQHYRSVLQALGVKLP
jgi:hypothetical protein